jgi:exopolyphosphatase/guanosine-5'-triphosphate,3'-diphosphate pyrophosphatase
LNAANFEKAIPRVNEISRTYDVDPSHTEHVTVLALALFDELASLHNFGASERRLLGIASRMHDIGWSQTVDQNHNKLSGDMILKMNIPGLEGDDKLVCALVARYHTKAIPDESKHELFASLPAKTRTIVEWLAGMLRVADALDSGHTGAIRRLNVQITGSNLSVHLYSNSDCRNEIRRAHRKEDLLAKKSERSLVYIC